MSYNDPVRLNIKGDRVVAGRYVKLARGLLLQLARETFEAGSAQAKRRIPLPNGVLIEIQLAGFEASIMIDVTHIKSDKIKIVEHFVVFPRTTDLPDGLAEEYPQLMLRPEEDGWRTLFFNTEVPGFDTFPGQKGTYRTNLGQLAFPDGVTHAGNIDWVNADGLRISWYGPPSRYFLMPHIQPRDQYGKFVFMLGQVLLDVAQYQIDAEVTFADEYVMGAALRGTSELIVVHSSLPLGTTPTTPVVDGNADISMPWPVGNNNITVRRYTLTTDPLEPGAMRLKVVVGSDQVIYSGTFANALAPWFFNESATAAVTVALPANIRAYVGEVDPEQPNTYLIKAPPPSPTQSVHTLDVNAGSVSSTSVTLAVGDSEATIACDFKGDELRQMTARRAPTDGVSTNVLNDVFFIRAGAFEQAMMQQHDLSPDPVYGGTVNRSVNRWLLHADLREDEVVIAHLSQRLRPAAPDDLDIYRAEIWRGGVMVATKELDPLRGMGYSWTTNLAFSFQWLDIVNDIALPPCFPLYVIYVLNFPSQSLYWRGRISGYTFRAYPTASIFGAAWIRTAPSSSPAISIPGLGTDIEFDGTQLDTDDQLIPLGCATYGEHTIYSGFGFGILPIGSALNMTAGPGIPTLPELTGVSGPKERYHPIWLLGTLPTTETP